MHRLITSLGEILIDFLPIEEGGNTVGFRMFPGGSLLNVAVGTARLGQPTAFAGKVSTDFFGRRLRAYAEGEGIDTRFLLNDEALSTLAFVAIEDNEPAFSFYGEGAADTLLTADELPQALFEETAILHIGSISLLRGSTPDAIETTFGRLKSQALLSLDPNLRPGLVKDEAGYRARLARLTARTDIFKISAADLGWYMPGVPLEEAAAAIAREGPALVVVTQGGKGGLALRPGEALQAVPIFPVQVADTVGAGDTFNAGMLTGLAERGVYSRESLASLPAAELTEVLRFAAAAAAINCTRAGANPPTRAEVAGML
ncbi:MAG: carbohydrate kinase [Chloroflexaceae bacterium]|jgi:fructokinase|nr:carbohydrate kinase [Chloroflexaceae bacterium]